jgi:histidinol-phosphatase (PHP family)
VCGRCCESFSYYDAQNEEILKLYYSLGGRKVTLGSDAHTVGGIGRGIAEATKQLAAMGFDGYYYYRNRKPVKIAFQKEG